MKMINIMVEVVKGFAAAADYMEREIQRNR